MRFEISFPDQPADEAGVLAQELRLALLRSGADPSKVEIVKERADTMDAGSWVEIALTAAESFHCALTLYQICAPAHSGIRVKSPRGTLDLSASEVSPERLRQIFNVADNDEHGG